MYRYFPGFRWPKSNLEGLSRYVHYGLLIVYLLAGHAVDYGYIFFNFFSSKGFREKERLLGGRFGRK